MDEFGNFCALDCALTCANMCAYCTSHLKFENIMVLWDSMCGWLCAAHNSLSPAGIKCPSFSFCIRPFPRCVSLLLKLSLPHNSSRTHLNLHPFLVQAYHSTFKHQWARYKSLNSPSSSFTWQIRDFMDQL